MIASTVALGFVLNAIIPGLGLPIGMAMGAVMSPTDAVATTIVKTRVYSGVLSQFWKVKV